LPDGDGCHGRDRAPRLARRALIPDDHRPGASLISSRDNPLLKDLRKLAQDPGAYRKLGRIWLEGDHLCRAALARGVKPAIAVFSESFWPTAPAEWGASAIKTVVVADDLLRGVSGLESPAPMGFVLDQPARPD
jgi:TrmH family RNA methyltransferase